MPYQCQLLYKGQPVTVVIADLAVPKCGNCGELVFDYDADEQINRAFEAQTTALSNGNGTKDEPMSLQAESMRQVRQEDG
jgi:hypothetical protein